MGKGRSRTASTTLKMEVFAPMPRARESTTIKVNPGRLRRLRKVKRVSRQNDSINETTRVGKLCAVAGKELIKFHLKMNMPEHLERFRAESQFPAVLL